MFNTFIFVFLLFFKFTIGKNDEELKFVQNFIEKDVYKKLHNIEENVILTENYTGYNLTYFIPICDVNINRTNNSILYSNCLVTGIMDLYVTNKNISLINTIFEISYDKLNFTLDDKTYTLSFNFTLNSKSFNMNLNKSESLSEDIQKNFENFENVIKTNFLNRFIELFNVNKNNNKKEEFNAILSLYLLKKPYVCCSCQKLNDNDENITYFKPFNYKLMGVIVTKNQLNVGKLIIYAEYAINYDLNYNEVEIIFENFCYEEAKMSNSTQSVYDIKRKKNIKELIINTINGEINNAYNAYFNKEEDIFKEKSI